MLTCAIPAPIVPSPTTPTLTAAILGKNPRLGLDQLASAAELVGRQPDVGVAPEALRKDAGFFDRRGALQIGHDRDGPDREAPAPAGSCRFVLGLAGDLDDAEDRLPDRGVEDRPVARLDRRSFRRRVRVNLGDRDVPTERVLAPASHEQPTRYEDSATR